MISQEFALMVLKVIPDKPPGVAPREAQKAMRAYPPYAIRQVHQAILELRLRELVVSNESEHPRDRKYWRASA